MSWFDRHRRLRERLSAYTDGQLASREAAELEAHLSSCEACSLEVEELLAVSAALRDLPAAPAPRSFALTEADVAAQRPRRGAAAVGPVNRGLRLTAAGLALALAAVVVVDMSGGAGRGGNEADEVSRLVAPGAMSSASSEAPGTDALQEEQAQQGPSAGVYVPPTPGEAAAGGPPAETPTVAPESGVGAGGAGAGYVPATGATEPPAGGVDALETNAETPTPAPGVPEAGLPQVAGTPTAAAPPLAADVGVTNGNEERGDGALSAAGAAGDSDDGPSALLVTEIVLGVLLGAAVVGAAGLTYAQRQRR